MAVLLLSALSPALALGAGEAFASGASAAVSALCAVALLGALAEVYRIRRLLQEAQARAVKSEVELQVFLEMAHDGIFRVDENGKIQEINSTMAQFLRYEPDFLKGRRLWDYLLCEDGPPGALTAQTGKARSTHLMTGKTLAGETAPLVVDLYAQKQQGRFSGFRGCARPAEKVLAEEKLKQKIAAELFQFIGRKLQDYLKELQGLSGAGGGDASAVRAGIEQATGRFHRWLTALSAQDVSRWKPELKLQAVDPRPLLEQVCARFEPSARARSQRLLSNCFGEAWSLSGDPACLADLLNQLVENALRYASEGGEVIVTYRETPQAHSFAVSDNGIGMSREELSRLFTPFFRADNPANAGTWGLGLGLWKARQIARAHGGSLSVESELGKETTFTFAMPNIQGKGERPKEAQPEVKWLD